MKSAILYTIYDVFDEWSHHLNSVCRRGCAHCCTQNVTMTALEGEAILRWLVQEDKTDWAANIIGCAPPAQPLRMTTNQFAEACMQNRDIEPDMDHNLSPCPFLAENLCTIYPVRPFSCRLFVSTTSCKSGQAATIPDYYFEAATATSQLIEHLGQKEYWGNMFDVLAALLDISEFRDIGERLNPVLAMQARMRTLTAQPLPGFLLSEENMGPIETLFDRIFNAEVNGRRIEDILNNG
jgi:Fe-S-cluster containining protein